MLVRDGPEAIARSRRMTLADLASLGSFVSGIAVLISVIYLALQVRQAAKHQRSLLLQGRTERMQEFSLRLADPALAPVLEKALGREGDLTIAEFRQVRSLAVADLSNFAEAHLQHGDGLLSDADFDRARQRIQMVMSFPRMRVLWRSLRTAQDPGVVRLVDDLISNLLPLSPEATLDEFNQAVAAEIAATRTATPAEWAEFMRSRLTPQRAPTAPPGTTR
jgi:hypothetical protein